MAKNSLNVDSLLKHKPDIKDLTYPAEPTYKPPTENETQAQHRERDLRNNKRKVDWETEFKQIAFKGPIVDGIPWDEADLKVRSLINLSLGTEGQRIYQQRFPHSNIERITVFELAHELALSFTQPRNITYDRFLLFTCKQKQNEKLESFHCRLKALGAKCRLGSAEEDFIKDIFIAFMTNTDIQKKLLMETRTAQQVLQFALNRERGQETQKAINSQLNRYSPHTFEQISNITHNPRNPSFTPRQRLPTRNIQTQRSTNIPNPCRRCGLQFSLEHLQICPAKKVQCNLGKTNVANPTNKATTKCTPTKHPTNQTGQKHQTIAGTTTNCYPSSGYPTGNYGGNSRPRKYILYPRSIRQLEYRKLHKPKNIPHCTTP